MLSSGADVAVIGAGPAGSFSALTAARKGAKVVVCEEHREVGLPSHCAGHISINGLKRLGLNLPSGIVENEIKGAVFYSPSGYEFTVRPGTPVTLVINRALFDRYLTDLAADAGAQLLLGTRVESLLLENNSVHGIHCRKGKRLESKVVIDAEGCASTLLKQTTLRTFDRTRVVSAVQGEAAHVKDVEGDMVEVYLGQVYAPGLFAWMIPRRDGTTKVGLATRAGNARDCLKTFLRVHPVARRKLDFGSVKNLSYHLIPLGGTIARTYHNGFLTVGDVASQVKPTTGGGVIMGLTCARIAGETAHQAVLSCDFSEKFLSRYQDRWKREIGFDMAVMSRIRHMLNSLSDKQIDRMIRMCSQVEIDRSLREMRDIDFQGKALLPVIKSPRAWVVFLYFFLASMM